MKKRKFSPTVLEGIAKAELGSKKRFFGQSSGYQGEVAGEFGGKTGFARVNLLRIITIATMVILLGRLFYLTIIKGEQNWSLAENNRVRLERVEAPRGRILDRNRTVLVESRQQFYLEKDSELTAITDSQLMDLTSQNLAGENFVGAMGRIVKTLVRHYALGKKAAHVSGYVSELQQQDFAQNSQLVPGEMVGRLGIEQSYDSILRGVDGKKIVEIDASGKNVSILTEIGAISGKDVVLTLDAQLQQVAYEALSAGIGKNNARAGALVITNVENGEIYALVSYPSYEPDDIGKYVSSEQEPLFNRAISGSYPPGSVFKIVTALAALDSGKITANTEIEDVGQFELGGAKFSNWYYLNYGKRDGLIKLDRAIARSNDIFFYRVGEEIGLEQIRKWAIQLGFGQKTGVDLIGEAPGLVPDGVWKKANFGDDWYLGDTLHLAIGQGFAIATPLQINSMTDFVANGGKLVVPHLLAEIESVDNKLTQLGKNSPGIIANESDLGLVREGMRQACQQKGTGWPFFNAPYTVGCKTGTAEKSLGNPHAWFTAFAPYENPQIAITVIVENGGEGSSVAGPIAREVLDWWFANNSK